MADTLEIFGVEYTDVAGIVATTPNETDLIYIRPQGTKSITQNGTGIDVASYASVDVNISSEAPTIESLSITPSESEQTFNASGVDGYKPVNVSAISSTYVGSGIARKSSTDLTVSGATVTAPAGYYAEAASASVSSMTLPTAAASSATSGYTSKATIGRSTAAQYINIPPGYNSAGAYYVISAVANGSTTAPASISGTAASVSTGNGTLTLTKTVSVTPSVTAGYISSGTAGDSSVSLTASVTIDPTPTASGATVTIPAGYYTDSTTKSVASGTAGTPTATKGTVSNHSINVTPSVTNTTGYITGSTKTGTAVTVSASELVSGNKAISANGTNIDVVNYATVSVTVDTVSNQDKSVTPTESEQEITADSGYTGLGTVTVEAISSTYVGSGITARSSTDLSASGATVTVPAGYYSTQATKSVSTLSLPTSTSASATSGYTSKATISRSTSDQYINIRTGYNTAGAYYKIEAVANGSATGPSSLSGSSATITTGTNTITLTKTGVTTTPTVSAGYVSSATASTATVALTASVTVNPTPTASGATVTIPAGYYSAQTTKSVTTMTLPTSAASNATSGYTKKATISRSTSTQYINIAPGYNSAGGYYEISAVANGSATGPSSLSGSSATVSTGTNTLTLTKTGVTTTPTVTAGYVSSATASTATVTLTASVTTKAAATITPTTTNQTIAAGTYLTGTQTIAGDADLIASNIKKDVNIFGVTGTYDPTDFIINLTQDSSNKWIPDCTFAEAEAALNSGKALKFVAEYPAGDAYFAGYDDFGKTIAYGVIVNTSTLNGAVLIDKTFIYDVDNTVTQDLTFTYYETAQATAQASDVVSTKTFFNGSGYQTGTLDLTDIYIRSAAPTSSVGSDGDIYIQE